MTCTHAQPTPSNNTFTAAGQDADNPQANASTHAQFRRLFVGYASSWAGCGQSVARLHQQVIGRQPAPRFKCV